MAYELKWKEKTVEFQSYSFPEINGLGMLGTMNQPLESALNSGVSKVVTWDGGSVPWEHWSMRVEVKAEVSRVNDAKDRIISGNKYTADCEWAGAFGGILGWLSSSAYHVAGTGWSAYWNETSEGGGPWDPGWYTYRFSLSGHDSLIINNDGFGVVRWSMRASENSTEIETGVKVLGSGTNFPGATSVKDLTLKNTPEGPYMLGGGNNGAQLWCYNQGSPVSINIPNAWGGVDVRVVGRYISNSLVIPCGSTIWRNEKILPLDELCNAPNWSNYSVGLVSPKNNLLVGTAKKGGEEHAVLLVPVEMAVDANRDGVIKFAGNYDDSSVSGKPYDKTEETKPLAFWLNDDDDRNDKDTVDSSHKDSDDGIINGRRDLEDFTRLNIYVGGLHEAIASGQIKVGLKWKNTGSTSPRVKVWRNLSPNGDIEYLTDDTVAQQHMTLGNPGDIHGTTAYIIPTQFWIDSGLNENQPNGYLLFEGVSEGKGQLTVTLHKADGSEIGEGPGVWLDLKNVKKMYVRAKGTPENGIDAPYESYFSQPNPPPTGYVDDPNGHPFQQPHGEADSLVVLVHGIHAPFTDATDAYKANIVSAEIVFKRLWHQGFKGRFAFYKWPALNPAGFGSTGFEFNGSEYRAWKYGRGLAGFVNSINKSSKNLYSHSQGNIVCGAALTDYELTVDNYVLTQAAVPAGCYDVSGGQSDPNSINGYARFWNKEASKPTPDAASDLGYRGYLQNLGVSGNVVNFHNQFDYALATGRTLWLLETHWEANQDSYKPDGSLSNGNFYTYVPGNPSGQRCQLVDALFVGRFVTNPHEAMSMVARPRSKAAGALGATRGKIDSDYDLSVGPLNFSTSSDDHGAQVARRIQEVWPYYTELGRTFGVIPLPE